MWRTMSDVWIKLIEQAPWAAAIILTVYMFLTYLGKLEDKRMAHDAEAEKQRTENAKERERERRDHEMLIANLQANSMKAMLEKMEAGMETIAKSLSEHDRRSREQYEKIGMTKDLIAAVNDKEKRR